MAAEVESVAEVGEGLNVVGGAVVVAELPEFEVEVALVCWCGLFGSLVWVGGGGDESEGGGGEEEGG